MDAERPEDIPTVERGNNKSQMTAEDKKIQYWLEISDYDLQTARAMLDARRYLYVGFMCHQSIEKILKAHWQKVFSAIPPRTHNLALLSQKTGLLDEMSIEHADFIDELEPLNIQARYPEYRDLQYKKLKHGHAQEILSKTEELFKWIRKRL